MTNIRNQVTPQPMTDEQRDKIRAALHSPDTTATELHTYAVALLSESDYLHGRADYWRESYRIASGQTDDELAALEVVKEATARHPAPCRWPDSPACACNDRRGSAA